MHNFWRGVGLVLLIVGLGVLTLIGGFTGIPTIISLIQAFMSGSGTMATSAAPNFLQSLQLTLTVIGIIALFAGYA